MAHPSQTTPLTALASAALLPRQRQVTRQLAARLLIVLSITTAARALAQSSTVVADSQFTAPRPTDSLSATPDSASQLAALGYLPDSLAASEAMVTRLEGEVTPFGQLGYRVSVDGALTYRDYLDGTSSDSLDGAFSISAQLDLALPADTLARSRQALERGRQEHRLLSLRGTRDALIAHGELLIAQAQYGAALASLALAARESDASEAGRSIEWREADLELREARDELAAAAAVAEGYGLPAAAHYLPVRFQLPGSEEAVSSYADSHGYRLLRLRLEEAIAERDETRTVLDDLRVRAGYRIREGTLTVEGGLINGLPRTNLSLSNTGGPDRWELQLSAQVVLGDGMADYSIRHDEVEHLLAELDGYPDRYRQEVDLALQQARYASEWLDLAEDEVREAYGEAVAVHEEAERAAEEAAASPRLLADVERSERLLAAARIRLYRAWISYVRAVATVAELTGGEWPAVVLPAVN